MPKSGSNKHGRSGRSNTGKSSFDRDRNVTSKSGSSKSNISRGSQRDVEEDRTNDIYSDEI